MIVKGGMSYLWSGTQGIKMDANKKNTSISSQTTTNNVDLDSQADYKCRNWTKDESKFVVPSSVNFMDLEEAIKGSGIFDFKKIKPQGN
jgi:hypothetical protein